MQLLRYELSTNVSCLKLIVNQLKSKVISFVKFSSFKIQMLYLNTIHFIKSYLFSIVFTYIICKSLASLYFQRSLFKFELLIRVISAPLWSSWLGYSALTREARVQFPVGE